MATQMYGPGRTVFLGFDSTYRWRYLHEEYFDGFWARLVDRVGRSKVLGGRYPFTLATDKTAYRVGDRVVVRAELVGSADETAGITELRGEVEHSGEAPTPLELQQQPEAPTVLEGSFQSRRGWALYAQSPTSDYWRADKRAARGDAGLPASIRRNRSSINQRWIVGCSKTLPTPPPAGESLRWRNFPTSPLPFP